MMKGVYKYSILKNLKLIIQFYQSDITLDGVTKLKQDVFQDKGYNSNYKILGDVRLSTICMTSEEVEDYRKWIGEKTTSNRSGSYVILTTTPQQVSLSMIFDLNKNFAKIGYKVCSTMEGALKILDIDISNIGIIENEIERMIVK